MVVCAPNAFKGTLSAASAAAAMARGVRAAAAAAVELPVADGGDGTLDVLLSVSPAARFETLTVTGPLRGQVEARIGWMDHVGGHAVVEFAEAAGLRLVPVVQLDPLRATSRGVGELIASALDRGAAQITVGTGGSASSDGGAGALAALGVRVLDELGRPLGDGGGTLRQVTAVDTRALHPRWRDCRIELAADVDAPLLGERGAAAVFAPQKGAGPVQVALLEEGLERLAAVLERDVGAPKALREEPGAGAAGGFGYGLAAIGARLRGGAALVCDELGIDGLIRGAALVLTGEGRLDASTATGKAPAEVAHRAQRAGVPCVALVGQVAGTAPNELFADVVAIGGSLTAAEVMRRTAELLEASALQVTRRFALAGQ